MDAISNQQAAENAAVANRSADVAIMTSVHPPFDTRIFVKQACSLVKAGHRVTLICCHPKSETVEGVKIHGLPKARGRLGRMFVTTFRVLRAAIASKAPICHFHDPELIPAGLVLKLLGRKVIYDIHEDVPQSILCRDWVSSLLRVPIAKIAGGVEWAAALAFDLIVTATPTIARRFPQRKTVVIQNFPIVGELTDTAAISYRDRPNAIVYVGAISQERGALQIIQAMEHIAPKLGAVLHLAGLIYPAPLGQKMKELAGWNSTEYYGIVDRSGVRDVLGKTRAGLVTLQPSPRYLDAYPVKLFEYWSAGIPVIASDFPLWREIVEGANGGILVDATDPGAIADAISWLLTHEDEAQEMGRNGRNAVLTRYNWGVEEKKMLAFYDNLMAFGESKLKRNGSSS